MSVSDKFTKQLIVIKSKVVCSLRNTNTPKDISLNRETHATITYKSNIYKVHIYTMMKRKQATSGFVGLAFNSWRLKLNSWRLKNSLSMANLCNRTSTSHHKIICEYNQMDALFNFDSQILFQIQKCNIYEVAISNRSGHNSNPLLAFSERLQSRSWSWHFEIIVFR